MTNFSRRGFIAGIIAACAAPAIVRVASIMPVKVMPLRGSWRHYSSYEILPIDPELAPSAFYLNGMPVIFDNHEALAGDIKIGSVIDIRYLPSPLPGWVIV